MYNIPYNIHTTHITNYLYIIEKGIKRKTKQKTQSKKLLVILTITKIITMK